MVYNIISDYPDAIGVMPMLYAIRDAIPIAFPLILFCIFYITFAGSLFMSKARTGREKVFTGLLSSSLVVTILGMFLMLMSLITYKLELFWGFMSIISFIALVVSDKT